MYFLKENILKKIRIEIIFNLIEVFMYTFL